MHNTTLQSYNNHNAFGMLQPNRHYTFSEEYKFGFQGQELENEEKGYGNTISFTFRDYDPRTGRMKSTDPLEREYPYYSPYAFSGNRVIDALEFEGLEPWQLNEINYMSKNGFRRHVNRMFSSYLENKNSVNVQTDCAKFQY
jgi:RHS repeat-associated protein